MFSREGSFTSSLRYHNMPHHRLSIFTLHICCVYIHMKTANPPSVSHNTKSNLSKPQTEPTNKIVDSKLNNNYLQGEP